TLFLSLPLSPPLFIFYLSSCRTPLYLPSFPTRRSSDLLYHALHILRHMHRKCQHISGKAVLPFVLPYSLPVPLHNKRLHTPCLRSEEHTSELQSQSNLVCRLLLEKKKKKKKKIN